MQGARFSLSVAAAEVVEVVDVVEVEVLEVVEEPGMRAGETSSCRLDM